MSQPSAELERARSILLCLAYGIGDIVMQTPALEALRAAAPSAHIRAIGSRPAIELLEDDPRIDELISIQDWGLSHWLDEGTPGLRQALRQWLSDLRSDLVLNPTDAVLALRWAVWNTGQRAFDRDKGSERAVIASGGDGLRALCVAIERGWGLPIPECARPKLYVHRRHREDAERRMEDQGLHGAALVGISPVASSPLKRWPPQRLAGVADALAERHDCRFLLFAGPEANPAHELRSHMHSADRVLTIGSPHLGEVTVLLAACRLFIGNDTGLMHIAASVQTPTIATFGPTSPNIYLPRSERAVAVGGGRVPCRHRQTEAMDPPGCWGCERCLIREASCIDDVSMEEVLSAAEEQLRIQSAQPDNRRAREPEPTSVS